MLLKDLKIGEKYWLSSMENHAYSNCTTQIYTKEYHKIKKCSFKLLGISTEGEYPTEGDTDVGNNVKLIHEETNIIIFSHCAFLFENNIHNEKNNFWQWEYKNSGHHNDQALSSNSIAKKYDYQRRTAFNVAKEKEFKLERIDNKQKARLIIAKLEMLIDETLKDINEVNGRKFLRYTKWLNLIKNKYNL